MDHLLATGQKRILWVEIAVMASFCFLPELWSTYGAGPRVVGDRHLPAILFLASAGVQVLSMFVPAVFIVWGSGDSLTDFGLRSCPFWKGGLASLGGIVCYLAMLSLLAFLYGGLGATPFLAGRHIPPLAYGPIALWFAFRSPFDEFTRRGYLIPRLTTVFGNRLIAMIASSLFSAVFLLYLGAAVAGTGFLVALYLAYSFHATKSIWPGVVAGTLGPMIFYVMLIAR